jgi:hypothetical protein
MPNFTIFWEEVGLDFGRVLQEGLIDIFIFVGEEDTRAGNVNKNGEICFATIE